MSSALKPVLSSGPQPSSVTNQVNKPMHSQGPPNTYGQPSSHVPENLVSSTHSNTSHSFANSSHQANHYSINVPNTSEHYASNTSSVTVSGHPLPVSTQASTGNQSYISAKSVPFTTGYQGSLTHPPSQNLITPPIVQNLPATQTTSAHTHNTAEELQERQSNGSSESEVTAESKDNCVATNKDSAIPTANSNSSAPEKQERTGNVSDTTNKNESSQSVNSEAKSAESHEVSSKATSVHEQGKASLTSSTESECVKNEDTTVSTSEKQKLSVTQCATVASSKTAEINNEAKKQDECKTEINLSIKTLESEKQAEDNEEDKHEKDTMSSSSSEDETATPEPMSTPVKPSDQATEQTKVQSLSKPSAVVQKTPPRRAKARTDIDSAKKQATPILKTPQGKSTRVRTRTQPYQSPLPEIEIITKISSAPKSKSNDDKLIVFYKNEFLAVRNSEGGFYVCQAVQNIYKSSQKKLKIRWLSQDKDEKSGEIYTPDFYDQTDFDCILTNLNLERIDKGKYRLPPAEKERTDSILNRSLAAEKGEVEPPSLTEEHPDGLDLSLYTEESQLKKRRGTKRKASSLSPKKSPVQKSPNKAKVQKTDKVSKKPATKATKITKKQTIETKKSTTNLSRNDRAKRRNDTQSKSKNSSVVDQKKAKVIAKVVKKSTMSISSANRNHTNAKNSKTLKPTTLKVTAKTSKPVVKPAKRSTRK